MRVGPVSLSMGIGASPTSACFKLLAGTCTGSTLSWRDGQPQPAATGSECLRRTGGETIPLPPGVRLLMLQCPKML